MKLEALNSYLETKSQELGFSHFGISPLGRPVSFEFYQSWLSQGLHGEMQYLETHAPIKEQPQKKWPQAKSALVFAMPYFPHPESPADFPLKHLRLSLYSQGNDYHHWLRQRLELLIQGLKEFFPEEEFISMTDSTPVLERDLAYRSGLGWVGKNTCLIHPQKGSLFFIAEIYTSLNLQLETVPVHDFCGTCRRCLDICPTQALTEPRKLDARKCISYWTIESRQVPPEELRESIGDWFFGCDLCQTVCPWNQKAFKNQLSTALMEPHSPEKEKSLEEELRWILESSGKQLEKAFHGTALSRAGSFGLKRNALVVIANRGLHNLRKEVEVMIAHPKLGELAAWTLQKLTDA